MKKQNYHTPLVQIETLAVTDILCSNGSGLSVSDSGYGMDDLYWDLT